VLQEQCCSSTSVRACVCWGVPDLACAVAPCLVKSFARALRIYPIHLCQNLKTDSEILVASGARKGGCPEHRTELCCGGGAVRMAAPCKPLQLVEWASGL
jgi:hypothetical protein